MKALLHSLLEAATLGRPVVLCTVVHSGGSAPRSAGAHMAVFADGSTRGTVGGGRLELLAAKEGLSLLQRQTSALRAYDLSEREGGIGMACGGNVIVSYLYLGPEQADFVRAMAAAFDATAPCCGSSLPKTAEGRFAQGGPFPVRGQPVWMPERLLLY
ncbi:MAG: XdhC family protein [Oscillospiraceae bacterium]